MEQNCGPVREPAEQVVKQIRSARRQFSAEVKIRIVVCAVEFCKVVHRRPPAFINRIRSGER
jgi:hypothetical protein